MSYVANSFYGTFLWLRLIQSQYFLNTQRLFTLQEIQTWNLWENAEDVGPFFSACDKVRLSQLAPVGDDTSRSLACLALKLTHGAEHSYCSVLCNTARIKCCFHLTKATKILEQTKWAIRNLLKSPLLRRRRSHLTICSAETKLFINWDLFNTMPTLYTVSAIYY